jgi:hypothetical protein
MKSRWVGIVLLGAASIATGCAEVRDTSGPSVHPPEWTQRRSVDFHGSRVVANQGPEICKSCHGDALTGTAATPGCSDCHVGTGGHPAGWLSPESDRFHANEVALAGVTDCTRCHGADHQGGWSRVSCFECHAGGPSGHPDGWLDEESLSFHGRRVREQGYESCTSCHGPGLGGGSSGVACAQCHE